MPVIIPLRRMRHGNIFRAMSLRLPDAIQGPFIGVDHAWMSGPVFPPHRHEGLSAVSYVFLDSESGISNRDNIGTNNLISPGGIHWTTAGSGIIHEEIPAEPNKTVHSLQIFVDLPDCKKNMPPAALSLNTLDVPVVDSGGCKIRIPVGSFQNVQSPLIVPTEVTILDITLEQGAVMQLPVPAGHCAFFLPIYGDTFVERQCFNHNDLKVPAFPAQETARSLRVEANEGRGKIMFFSGPPLHKHEGQ